MSDIPSDLNLREELGRIDRQREETLKFVAEQHKLVAETTKLGAEAAKFISEARKLDRDRGLAPWQAATLTVGGIAALVASVISLAKSMGWL